MLTPTIAGLLSAARFDSAVVRFDEEDESPFVGLLQVKPVANLDARAARRDDP